MASGILIVDKPEDWTSQDVVAKLRGALHERRAGHGGTLDPMATGVLPVFFGRATRAVEFFEHAEKTYEAVLRLGLVTDTQDITGRVLEQRDASSVTEADVRAALPRFLGPQKQVPPMYSAIKIGGKTAAIWIVVGIMDREDADVPSYVMRTTPERYDKSLEFLETLSKQMFAVKMEELMAQEAVLKSRESETQMEAELHRNEVMTSIVKMLESENSFEEIVHDILRECCAYMEISRGALLKENKEHSKIEMICEYAAPGMDSVRGEWSGVPREKMPFFNGKPYMISSNSMMPEVFRQFFDAHGLLAGIFLPVEVNTRAEMYLCFLEEHEERNWEVTDVKFVNDVRRIIQSILLKRIAKNSLASSYASLEAILENVGCGIYVKDPVSGRILYSNQRLRAFLPDDAAPDMLENCWRDLSGAGKTLV